jgi:hypothetical protein
MGLLVCSNLTSSSVIPRPIATRSHCETIRPILEQERTLAQHSRITGLSYGRLWRDLRRFRRAGVIGLLDRRTLPHPRGRPPIATHLPQSIQQRIVRPALAHPFTARKLARIVRECYHQPIDYRGIQRVLAQHRLSPAVLQRHHQAAQPTSLPPPLPAQQLTLPLEPHTLAQRLALASGPEHLLCRFRTYDEYPTEEQARWRIITATCRPSSCCDSRWGSSARCGAGRSTAGG